MICRASKKRRLWKMDISGCFPDPPGQGKKPNAAGAAKTLISMNVRERANRPWSPLLRGSPRKFPSFLRFLSKRKWSLRFSFTGVSTRVLLFSKISNIQGLHFPGVYGRSLQMSTDISAGFDRCPSISADGCGHLCGSSRVSAGLQQGCAGTSRTPQGSDFPSYKLGGIPLGGPPI